MPSELKAIAIDKKLFLDELRTAFNILQAAALGGEYVLDDVERDNADTVAHAIWETLGRPRTSNKNCL